MNFVTVETTTVAVFRRCRGQTQLFQSLTDEIRTFLKLKVTSVSFLLYPMSFTPSRGIDLLTLNFIILNGSLAYKLL